MGRGRTLAGFQKEFPDEARCAGFLFARRWPDGFVCPACGRGRAVALKSRPRLLECLDCGRQTSLTAGTAMHRSKLPLTMWFWAAHLMATHSNGMSARQLEDQLGVTYKTAWLLAQKLRRSMVDPGLIDSWCKSLSYNGIIRARSNSTPARPYMARLRVFSLLICPSVCPLLQGSDMAFRTASRSWRIVFAKRCIA